MQKSTVSSQPERNDDTFVLVYGRCVILLYYKLYLFTFMHLADGFIQSDSWRAFWPPAFTVEHNSLQFQHVSLFISYVSSVVKNLPVSCTSPLVSKFPSEYNVYRPQYPSRLHKEVSWSQISCVVSFPQKRARLSISHSSSDQVMKCRHMRKATGIFILQLFLFPWRAHCEKVLVRSNQSLAWTQ